MRSKELVAFRAGAAVASWLPVGAVSAIGRGCGGFVGLLPDYDGRRAVVASHMTRAVGRPLGRVEARRMVAGVFANYGRYWAVNLKIPSMSREEVAAGIDTVGREHLDAALAKGHGVVLAPPHLGDWELGAHYLTGTGLAVTVAVEPLRPPEVFRWFLSFRERLGMHVVAVGPGAAGAILRALKQNHVVCLLSDRLVGKAAGIEVEFFGEKAMMPAGPVTLAARSGAPLIPAAIYNKAGGAHTIVFRPPLDLGGGGRTRDLVPEGTQALARELEALVRRAPTQWHLVQPNWPSDPEVRRRRRPWTTADAAPEAVPGTVAEAG